MTLAVGLSCLGTISDALGDAVMSSNATASKARWLQESPAPGIMHRHSVCEPLETGVIGIDALIPVGLGQRELLVGDRQTGKTSLAMDGVLNQRSSHGVLCCYVACAQGATSILEVFLLLVESGAVRYTALVGESSSALAVQQYLVVYTATAFAEYLCFVHGFPSYIIYDDLSKHAVAYREVSLLLRRSPGREAYPGEIFYVHSRLLERSAKISTELGAGSVTAFPVIETLSGDCTAYIPTNVISITDGQLFLSLDLFHSGRKPAIDVGLSVSRVGSAAQRSSMKMVSATYKLEMAQYAELVAFSQFSSDLGAETRARFFRSRRFVAMMCQPNGSPMQWQYEVGLIAMANHDILQRFCVSGVRVFVACCTMLPVPLFTALPSRLLGMSIQRAVL
jgi:F-type H+-transporting ATPase subunit alpha